MVNKRFNYLYILISLLLMIGSSLYDYKISLSILNPGSFFGLIFAGYGILPVIVGLMVVGFIFYYDLNKTAGVLLIFFTYIFSIVFCLKNGININIIALILINFFVYVALSYFLYFRIKDDPYLLKKALLILMVIVFQFLVVHLLKITWLRPRMKFIISNDYDFLPWYIRGSYIKNISDMDLIMSFPSGHTASAACSLLLLCFNNGKKFKIFSLLWIILIGISRIIIGAHFLSDIVVGSFITFLVYNLFFYFILSKNCVNICENSHAS